METDIPHYNSTNLAFATWKKAQRNYVFSSNDYHRAGNRSNYQAEWMRAGAYDLSVKQAKLYATKAEYERKKRLFERINRIEFVPTPYKAEARQASTPSGL